MADGGPSITEAPEQGGAPAPGGPPGGGQGGPPGGGAHPLLAALAQRQGQPQISIPGQGDQASSMTMVMNAVGMLSQALPGLMGSPLHAEVAGIISRLGKRVNRNAAPTIGVQRTQLDGLRQALGRNALLAMLMQQQQAQGGQQGGQPGGQDQGVPPGAAPSPMPSTPFPGA